MIYIVYVFKKINYIVCFKTLILNQVCFKYLNYKKN
jgi:hypothetical protein